MSFSIALHSTPRRAVVRFDGDITTRNVREACRQLLSLPDWRPGTAQVWDFLNADDLDVDQEGWAELLTTSRENQSAIGDHHMAVVSQDPDVESFLDLYARTLRQSSRTFRLVPSREQAEEWLATHAEGTEA